MKMKLLTSCALVVGLVMVCAPVFAHHGSRVSYDLTKPVTMKGTITSFEWQNPHVFLSYDAKDASGNVTNWGVELAENPRMLINSRGWTKDTLKPGDEITATFFASKAGTPRGILSKLELNGKMIYENNMRGPE
jgi:Family of unknown function (DUF6152)